MSDEGQAYHELALNSALSQIRDEVGKRLMAETIIRDCQKILAEHIDPSGPEAKETISKLLAILDGPRVRELMDQERK